LNGIFWRLRTECALADIGALWSHTTCVNRFNRWRKAGVCGPYSQSRVKGLRRRHPDDRLLFDRVHSARRQRPKKSRRIRLHGSLARGLTTKIHALVDAEACRLT